jgi:hypothetical protein
MFRLAIEDCLYVVSIKGGLQFTFLAVSLGSITLIEFRFEYVPFNNGKDAFALGSFRFHNLKSGEMQTAV